MAPRLASSLRRPRRSHPTGVRGIGIVLGSVALALAGARCSSDSSTPTDPISKVPDFVYVSNAAGSDELYTWHKGVTALFPATISGDIEPQSAAGKVVFTSYRISYLNAEIYIANLDGSNALRLTNSPGTDDEPSISPDGSTIVFRSLRSGTSRIWTMGADGSNPMPVSTGSSDDLPESSPRYSPGGGRILFSSPRTNTTQIWIVPTSGGAATQVTHEVNGAFDGSWSPDGNTIYYVDGSDRTRIHRIDVATGTVTDFVTGGADVGDASCTAILCLVVSGATGSNGDIYAFFADGTTAPLAILVQSTNDRQPAILHP